MLDWALEIGLRQLEDAVEAGVGAMSLVGDLALRVFGGGSGLDSGKF